MRGANSSSGPTTTFSWNPTGLPLMSKPRRHIPLPCTSAAPSTRGLKSEPPAWILRNLRMLDGPFALRQLGPDTQPFVDREFSLRCEHGVSHGSTSQASVRSANRPDWNWNAQWRRSGCDFQYSSGRRNWNVGRRGRRCGTSFRLAGSRPRMCGSSFTGWGGGVAVRRVISRTCRGYSARTAGRFVSTPLVFAVYFSLHSAAKWLAAFSDAALARGIIDESRAYGEWKARMSTSPNDFRVSVVIPAYNAAKYLAETLDSVLAQAVLVHEILVIDDGSGRRHARRCRTLRRSHHVHSPTKSWCFRGAEFRHEPRRPETGSRSSTPMTFGKNTSSSACGHSA